MNKKIMIIGAGAALLLGSVAIAQTTSDQSTSNTNSSSYQAPNANNNAADTAATPTDQNANNANANAADTSATAGERG